jgi:hypothetical protein
MLDFDLLLSFFKCPFWYSYISIYTMLDIIDIKLFPSKN